MLRPSPNLLEVIYQCQQRQDWYMDWARVNREDPLEFVSSARQSHSPRNVAQKMRDTLGIDLGVRRDIANWTEALRQFIDQADSAGILVMVSGIVGSNTSRKLDPNEFRGFTLVDPLAPVVFVNGADTKAAQMFTLAHELAHVWLGASGVSDEQAAANPDEATERWCNSVAAEFLVPLEILAREYTRTAPLHEEVGRLAKLFKVSTLVVLRRIFDAGGLSQAQLWREYGNELQRLQAVHAGTGGNFYAVLRMRVSKRFARAVVISTLEGQTLQRDACRMLGVSRSETFDRLAENLEIA